MKGEKIQKKMTLGEVVKKYPETAEVMLKYGLHCVGCHVAAWETIEQGSAAHGLDKKKVEEMLKEMNKAVSKRKSQ